MYNRLYIHVPFCVRKCNYCAFCSAPAHGNDIAEYSYLLQRELLLHDKSSRPLESIYFGGGTPSLLLPEQIKQLIIDISQHSGIAPRAEITLEVNPGTVTSRSFLQFKAAGVNRISLGIQTFDDQLLTRLGRIHSAAQGVQAFKDARSAGYNNISIDLINSLPTQSLQQWQTELRQAMELKPQHISVYGLTIENDTVFSSVYPPESPELADEDLAADMFELSDEFLTGNGYDHYEIANYTLPGFSSRHNSGYWQRDGYLGLGVSAHSFLRRGFGERFTNPATLDEYRSAILSGVLPRLDNQSLSRDSAMSEHLFLGLRLQNGISKVQFENEFGCSVEDPFGAAFIELEKHGLLIHNEETVSLTRRGWLLSNYVLSRFIL